MSFYVLTALAVWGLTALSIVAACRAASRGNA